MCRLPIRNAVTRVAVIAAMFDNPAEFGQLLPFVQDARCSARSLPARLSFSLSSKSYSKSTVYVTNVYKIFCKDIDVVSSGLKSNNNR